jgi:hypothetical protein
MGLAQRVSSIVAFFRAGCPAGAPALGYVALLALLPRRLSDDEIAALARKLTGSKRRKLDRADLGVAITRVTDEMPLPNDIERIQRRLSAIGSSGGLQDTPPG